MAKKDGKPKRGWQGEWLGEPEMEVEVPERVEEVDDVAQEAARLNRRGAEDRAKGRVRITKAEAAAQMQRHIDEEKKISPAEVIAARGKVEAAVAEEETEILEPEPEPVQPEPTPQPKHRLGDLWATFRRANLRMYIKETGSTKLQAEVWWENYVGSGAADELYYAWLEQQGVVLREEIAFGDGKPDKPAIEARPKPTPQQLKETTPQHQGTGAPSKDRDSSSSLKTCMEAGDDGCTCRCRGKYHGKEHPAGWRDDPDCAPLSKEEKKAAKRTILNNWRKNHRAEVNAYMKEWRLAKQEREGKAEEEALFQEIEQRRGGAAAAAAVAVKESKGSKAEAEEENDFQTEETEEIELDPEELELQRQLERRRARRSNR